MIRLHLCKARFKALPVEARPLTKERVLKATALGGKPHRLIGKQHRPGGVVHKYAAVKTVKICGSQQ